MKDAAILWFPVLALGCSPAPTECRAVDPGAATASRAPVLPRAVGPIALDAGREEILKKCDVLAVGSKAESYRCTIRLGSDLLPFHGWHAYGGGVQIEPLQGAATVTFELEFEGSRLSALALEREYGKRGIERLVVEELGYPNDGETWCEGKQDGLYLECSPAGSGVHGGIRYMLKSWEVGGGKVVVITTSGPYRLVIVPRVPSVAE